MSHLNFDYVPLTFVTNQEEIKKQIRNTLILIHLFEKYNAPVRLENLIEGTQYGYNASALQSGRNKFMRISDIHESKVNWETVPFCNCDDEKTYLLKNEDILIARTGGTTGKSFKIVNPPANSIYAGYLIRIRAKLEVNPDYIYLFLHSFAYWSQIVNLNERNFRPKANAENLKSLILPDCPRDIQNHAVKISSGETVKGYEELYAEIEKTLAEYDKTLEVQKLLSDQLTQLENLNQAILQEAVRGKLVKQDPKDEPASALLKRIKTEKANAGKKEKLLPSIKPEEISFDIPESWVWTKLYEICYNITDGTHYTPTYFKEGIIFLSSKNVTSGKIDWNNIKYIDEKQHREMQKRVSPQLNDILLAKNGTTGVAALVDRDVVFDIYVSLALLRAYKGIYPPYLLHFINSSIAKKQFNKRLRGIGVPNLHLNQIREVTIPIPPLAEQKRIVAEIEKQLSKAKQLKEHIITNQQATEELLKALLHQAFEVKEEGIAS
jgi:type I restriction enzyme, S subunit